VAAAMRTRCRTRFGPYGTLGRSSGRGVVPVRDLREALPRLNPERPEQSSATHIVPSLGAVGGVWSEGE
jgi:hypothetical protein